LGDPDCGDFLEMTILLSDDFQRIADIAFLVKRVPSRHRHFEHDDRVGLWPDR
jgi:hypothetical protein